MDGRLLQRVIDPREIVACGREMTEKLLLNDQQIIDCLHTYYGIEIASLDILHLGADTEAFVYQARTLDQTPYFLKVKRGHSHDIALEIIKLLEHGGVEQIISPLKTIQGQIAQRLDGFTLIVYPFVDGQDGFHQNLTDEQWITLGKVLKQIHGINVPLRVQDQIRKETYSPKWRNIVRSIYAHLETLPITNELALTLQTFLKKNRSIIHRLVDRAELLGEKLQKQSPRCVLCHSDLHAGNVLIDQNGKIYIVDWDEPIMAPKERDLMFIGGGVGNAWNQPHEEILFYQGYGKTEIDQAVLSYYRHERIVEDIAIYSQELLIKTAEEKDKAEMYRHFLNMFAPRGVVEIAFETDEAN